MFGATLKSWHSRAMHVVIEGVGEFPQFAGDILSIVLDQKEKSRDMSGDHSKPRAAIGAPATDGDAVVTAKRTPRTGRKRPRTSTVL